MTPSQQDLMKIVKVINDNKGSTPGSSVIIKKGDLRSSRLNHISPEGSIDGGDSLAENSVISDNGMSKINPKFRKH